MVLQKFAMKLQSYVFCCKLINFWKFSRGVLYHTLFCGSLVLVSWQAFISSLVMKLDFISQPSSKSTLPFAGLQHMQQLISTQFLLPCIDPNEWCIKNGLRSGGLNPRPLSHESSALNTRPRLLASQLYPLLRLHL